MAEGLEYVDEVERTHQRRYDRVGEYDRLPSPSSAG